MTVVGGGAEPGFPRRVGIVLAAALAAFLSGGTVYVWQNGAVEQTRREFQDRERLLTNSLAHTEAVATKRGAELEGRIAVLEKHVEQLGCVAAARHAGPAVQILNVYGLNLDSCRPEISFCLAVPKGLPVIDRLRLLAGRLSRLRFRELPIKVLRIERRGRRRIAVVDIREFARRDSSLSWRSSYFQGSSGGWDTEITLTLSFLQPDLKGDWVDGVTFLYNGKPPGSDDWDHIDLSGTRLRSKKKRTEPDLVPWDSP